MAHGNRSQKLRQRYAYGLAKARRGGGVTLSPGNAVGPRGVTARHPRGTPPPPRGVSAGDPPIHPSLCAMSPPASDHPQDSGVYWKHSQQYGEGWADGAKILGKSGKYFVVEVWGNVYRMEPCKSTRR
jgi:hypothetical protein